MRQGGGGLVHNDDMRIDRHGARYGDEVFFGDTKFFELGIFVNMSRTHFVKNLTRLVA